MSTTLRLVVPDGREKAVMDAYYEYVVEKLQRRDVEWAPAEPAEYDAYQLTRESYADDGEVQLYETISSTVVAHADWDAVRELFSGDDGQERTICDDEQLVALTELLRAAIASLEDEQPERNWADNLETQAIALCEFARRNDFCIELVP